ncbi:MAG: serine/threonine protein kinase [Polyangia bacterium]
MRDKTKGGMSRIDTLPDGFDKLIGQAQLIEGEVIGGRYKLIQSLGNGGMGQVFVAENIAIGMRVAVKLLKPELLANPEFRARFQNEAQAVASIEHPNVARFFDLVVGDPTFIVMEYVRGETLAALIKHGPLPVGRALAIAQRLCWGLDAAHAAGVVHRDLKPANVLLAPDAEHGEAPKLIDFGLAKLAAAAGDSQLTRTGQIIGTPAYMSPEQIKGEKIDGRADVYALGCVLFEMLTGHTPFASGTDDVQILYRQMHEAPPPLAKYLPDVSPALDALMDKALQKEPGRRFPSVQAMAAALAEIEAKEARRAGPSGSREHSGRVVITAQRLLEEQRRARARKVALGAVALALVVGVIGGVALVRWRHAPSVARSLLVVTSQPAGAQVTVDGRAPDGDETTPTALRDLRAGKHTVRIAKEGYAVVERALSLGDGERAALDIALSPETRRVEVQTSPDGASLYVDGHLVPGTTPTTVALTVDDFHELRAERIGYETGVRALKPEDRDATVMLTLAPERHPRGTLVVEAQVVAEVWLDGAPTGLTTPTLGFHVATGDHTVELRATSGERSLPKKVRVTQGQTLRLTMALDAKKTTP